MSNNNNQQTTSLESGIPSVGSIVSYYMIYYYELKDKLNFRFGLLDVHVLNKQ
jgi:hypothetical protein